MTDALLFNKRIRILLLDTGNSIYRVLAGNVEAAGNLAFDLECQDRMDVCLQQLENNQVDALVIVLNPSGGLGIEDMENIQTRFPALPLFVVNDEGNDQVIFNMFDKGALQHNECSQIENQQFAGCPWNNLRQDRTENILQKSIAWRNLLSLALESAANSIFVTDREGKILWVNHAFSKCSGYTPEELIGQTPRIIKSGKHDARFYQQLWDTILAGKVWHGEITNRRKDGTIYVEEATITPVRRTDGHITHFIGIKSDVTWRLQAEERLRKSEERFRLLFEGINDGILISQFDHFVFFNSRMAEMLGYKPEEFLGKGHIEVYTPESLELLQQRKKAHERGERISSNYEAVFRKKDGSLVPVEINARTIRYEGFPAIFAVIRDVSDRRRLEAQLRHAVKMEAIGRLAGGIAHDFNNLLTGIIGNITLIRMHAPPNLMGWLEEAEKASNRAAELVKQLLTFGRKTDTLLRPVNVAELLHEVVGMVRKTFDRQIEIVIRCQPDLHLVFGDPSQIHQILLNLCINARDALETSCIPEMACPRIILEARNILVTDEYCIRHTYARPGPHVYLTVSDNGVGMDEETQRRIFEPFFTTKGGKGSGLGLAVVYGIVKQHRGWIHVHSRLGEGTTFEIYLPQAENAIPVKTEESSPREIPRGVETILLVDDEQYIRQLGHQLLSHLGYQVIEANDGVEALKIYSERGAQIDLVLLDLSMPRLSGREVLAQLLTINPNVRVIVSSGYSSDGEAYSAETLGACAFISKPYRLNELATLIRNVLKLSHFKNEHSPSSTTAY